MTLLCYYILHRVRFIVKGFNFLAVAFSSPAGGNSEEILRYLTSRWRGLQLRPLPFL